MAATSLAEQLRRDLAARRVAPVHPARGVHTATPGVNAAVTPEGACFFNGDSGLGEVFTPGTPFTPLNSIGECATQKAEPAAALRTCAGCGHRTRRKTCGEPEAAGLVAPDRFSIVWCELLPDGWAKTCPAFILMADPAARGCVTSCG